MERLPDLFEWAKGSANAAGEGAQRSLASRPVQWRMITEGGLVWAPFGEHGWRAATVTGLGKNRGDRTVVHLSFETGGQGRRIANVLFWRKPELKGQDKPSRSRQMTAVG